MENFIINSIDKENTSNSKLRFRFPPEPNGYLHLGHAKSICLNFGLAKHYQGTCHLRFDDTNPNNEHPVYYQAIRDDLKWLGFLKNNDQIEYTSNHFRLLFHWATLLIVGDLAYTCSCSPRKMARMRGQIDGKIIGPGTPCHHRNISKEKHLENFLKMRNGQYKDGKITLRAKIDINHENINLRDPVMYRVNHISHYKLKKDLMNQCNCGCNWCVYPSYDWAHGQSDAIERINYSVCTLEFESHRPLYNWFLQRLKELNAPELPETLPRQIEFARLNITNALMSKRKLKELIGQRLVDGWDDPRLPTISGMRRRGFPAQAIKDFCYEIGVSKTNSLIQFNRLENHVRDYLNQNAPRRLVVTKPIKLIIENYPTDLIETFEIPNHPKNTDMGFRKVRFSRELWIESTDFMIDAPKKFFRLKPNHEVRLKYAYIIKCISFTKDPQNGLVTEIKATYDPNSRGGMPADGRKIKGTIHWLSNLGSSKIEELRLFNPLFTSNDLSKFNEKSIEILKNVRVENNLMSEFSSQLCDINMQHIPELTSYQFERMGYFILDSKLSSFTKNNIVVNQIVPLKDQFSKILFEKKVSQKPS